YVDVYLCYRLCFCLYLRRPPPGTPLFPYTTLFRSRPAQEGIAIAHSLGRSQSQQSVAQLGKQRDAGRHIVADAVPLDHCELRIVDRKSTRLNSSHLGISYAVFCLKKKKKKKQQERT